MRLESDVMKTYIKDPDAVLDYKNDWSDWLGTDTISSSIWNVPAGITKDSDIYDSISTTIWLSGGTAGNEYEIVNRIVTASGRTEDRTFRVKMKDR